MTAAQHELERLETRRKKLVQSIMDGVPGAQVKDELIAAELNRQIDEAKEPPPLLHANMANVYRQQVAQLAEALEHEESGAEAAEALRGLVESVILTPDGDQLRIELKGNLAAMLGAAQKTMRSPDTGDLMVQIKLVAGACNQRYLQLWSGAA